MVTLTILFRSTINTLQSGIFKVVRILKWPKQHELRLHQGDLKTSLKGNIAIVWNVGFT